ncbi:mitochondrial triosephosphate isomerase [Metarhizium robertsii ARSEF 23]|uniref:Mitochondrial triosephosphate isomerase n=1 Tax=Metarhizium robertsii (strain ARSEF 23 / ATCC MYA-3075) TaxID=655844 RepID=A0A0B2X9R6_METRA|nr:mitochondrial triosephosphate isomerase [Metarhizium robertsii ARSEF 23]KHO11588.1 mitochondrial triosephosphate isomerase [Metarhizium robertsii ARSEF 23]
MNNPLGTPAHALLPVNVKSKQRAVGKALDETTRKNSNNSTDTQQPSTTIAAPTVAQNHKKPYSSLPSFLSSAPPSHNRRQRPGQEPPPKHALTPRPCVCQRDGRVVQPVQQTPLAGRLDSRSLITVVDRQRPRPARLVATSINVRPGRRRVGPADGRRRRRRAHRRVVPGAARPGGAQHVVGAAEKAPRRGQVVQDNGAAAAQVPAESRGRDPGPPRPPRPDGAGRARRRADRLGPDRVRAGSPAGGPGHAGRRAGRQRRRHGAAALAESGQGRQQDRHAGVYHDPAPERATRAGLAVMDMLQADAALAGRMQQLQDTAGGLGLVSPERRAEVASRPPPSYSVPSPGGGDEPPNYDQALDDDSVAIQPRDWSVYSGLNLMDIPALSSISLPLILGEIQDAYYYTEEYAHSVRDGLIALEEARNTQKSKALARVLGIEEAGSKDKDSAASDHGGLAHRLALKMARGKLLSRSH